MTQRFMDQIAEFKVPQLCSEVKQETCVSDKQEYDCVQPSNVSQQDYLEIN